MKTKLFVVLLFPIFGFISTETKAQIKTNPKFSWFNKINKVMLIGLDSEIQGLPQHFYQIKQQLRIQEYLYFL